ncbi:MAG: iron-siderophore ABC transporter substrate-binding protein [Myxococcales bacterium]|nr:iron-siderophore ABC transporter substrate-binding protein [Myxococcales bacterium]MCB9552280.1 iron-siderophore ABC transporter substrate-binding protein [Myxococcales bacterium]
MKGAQGIALLLALAALVAGAVVVVRFVEAQPAAAREHSRAPEVPVPGTGPTPIAMTPLPDGTVRVEHVYGTAVIPAKPRRVASLGWNDELIAAGVRPHAAAGNGALGFEPHLAEHLRGTVLVDVTAGGPDLETLAAAKPDLIIAVWYWQGNQAQLEAIAPTVVLQPGHWYWRERFLDVAALVGRLDEGKARLAAVEARIATVRERIHRRVGDGTVAMLRVFAREYRLYGHGYSGPLLYGDLGLRPPRLIAEVGDTRDLTRLSLEGITTLDADHLLLMYEARVPISRYELDRLLAHPVWQRLPAVRAGHVYPVPDLLMRGGVISREVILDELATLLGGET